jgi:uncharacterized membrane protein
MNLMSHIGWVAWNLFLAAIPVVLGRHVYAVGVKPKGWGSWVAVGLVGVAWLLFLPNTCYLLTEWRHYLSKLGETNLYIQSQQESGATLWLMVYTAFYFVYSAVGMLAFALAIRPVERLARRMGLTSWVWGIPLFGVTSVGVYLGLVLRFNSWDFLVTPRKIWYATSQIAYHPTLAAFVLLFAMFLWFAYVAIDIWVDGFKTRLKEINAG